MTEVSFKNPDGSASNIPVAIDTSGNAAQALLEEARARHGVSLTVGSHVDLSDGGVAALVKPAQEEVAPSLLERVERAVEEVL